jgi:hypothetical protein
MKTSLMVDVASILGIFILVLVGSTGAMLLLLKGLNAYLDRKEQKRRTLLKGYVFPIICYSELQQRYPHLTAGQVALAFEQLRLYFEVCLVYSSPSSSRLVAMPSKLADTCWHALICETREYQAFCKTIFGGFLHHESKVNTSFPLVDISADDIKHGENTKLSPETQAQQEIDFKNRLAAARIYPWSLSMGAYEQNSNVVEVPLLFSIDQMLNIKDGYFYSSEILEFLAKFDLKAAEAVVTKRETEAAAGTAAACGDGGASCGGCGGSA